MLGSCTVPQFPLLHDRRGCCRQHPLLPASSMGTLSLRYPFNFINFMGMRKGAGLAGGGIIQAGATSDLDPRPGSPRQLGRRAFADSSMGALSAPAGPAQPRRPQ